MCHTDIGGCKVGVLHRLLIEFILKKIKVKLKYGSLDQVH
jgi:hypothetical protein